MTRKTRLDASKSDAALLELYERLKARSAPGPGAFTTLDTAQRREYYRLSRRKNRAREREAAATGAIAPTTSNVRSALADAALMILATNAPGADQVRAVLAGVFAKRPGVPSSVEHKARSGRLRPKLTRIPT